MKSFLTFIILFFIQIGTVTPALSAEDVLSSGSQDSNEVSPLLSTFSSTLEMWKRTLTDLDEQARNMNEDEAIFQEDYNPFNLIYLDQKEYSPLTGHAGYGDYVSQELADVRLVSAYAGTGNHPTAFLALQVKAAPGVQLKDISLTDQTPKIKNVLIGFPEQGPLIEQYTPYTYEGNVFFPLIYHLSNPQESYHFQVLFQATACIQNTCHAIRAQPTLELLPDKRFATPLNAYLFQTLQHTPRPMPDEIQTKAYVQDTDKIEIHFQFPQKITYLRLKPLIPDAQVIGKYLNGTNAIVTVHLTKTTPLQTIPMIVASSVGLFQTTVPLEMMAPPIPEEKTASLWGAFLAGCLLFLCSPFLAYLTKPLSETERDKTRALRSLCFILLLAACLLGISLPDTLLAQIPNTLLLCFLICLLVSFLPYQNYIGVMVLFFLIPKPYLTVLMPFSIPGTLLCAVGALGTAYMTDLIKSSFLKKERAPLVPVPQSIPFLITRLPLFFLTAWYACGWMASFYTLPAFSAEKLHTALEKNQKVLVVVETETCVLCRLNKLVALNTGYPRLLQKQNKLLVLQSQLDAAEIQPFLKNTHAPRNTAVTLLFGPQQREGVALPSWISYYTFNKALSMSNGQ